METSYKLFMMNTVKCLEKTWVFKKHKKTVEDKKEFIISG